MSDGTTERTQTEEQRHDYCDQEEETVTSLQQSGAVSDGRQVEISLEDDPPPLPAKQKAVLLATTERSSKKRKQRSDSSKEITENSRCSEEANSHWISSRLQSKELVICVERSGITAPNERCRPKTGRSAQDKAEGTHGSKGCGDELAATPSRSKPRIPATNWKSTNNTAYVNANSSETPGQSYVIGVTQNTQDTTFVPNDDVCHNLLLNASKVRHPSDAEIATNTLCLNIKMAEVDESSVAPDVAWEAQTREPAKLQSQVPYNLDKIDQKGHISDIDCATMLAPRTIGMQEVSTGQCSNVLHNGQGSNSGQDRDSNPQDAPCQDNQSRNAQCIQMSSSNDESQKKGFLQSLGRKTKLRRQDTRKSQRKVKEPVPPKPRGDPWITMPRHEDFMDTASIQEYLETKRQLTRALAQISLLENQSRRAEAASMDGLQKTQDPCEEPTPPCSEKSGSHTEEATPSQTKPSQRSKESEEVSTFNQEESQGQAPQDSKERDTVWSSKEEAVIIERGGIEKERQMERYHCIRKMATDDHALKLDLGTRGHDKQEIRRVVEDRELPSSSTSSRFTLNLQTYCSKEALKYELKMAILDMSWSEEEWRELTELIRMKRRKKPNVPYINLNFHERQGGTLATGYPNQTGFSQERETRTEWYVNLPQTFPQEENDMAVFPPQRYGLANRQYKKPPMPTPRHRSSPI